MKNVQIIFAALIGLTAASCSLKEDRLQCTAPVSVHVNNFAISMDEFPDCKSLQDPADYSGVGAITLAFYANDTEVYKSTQIQSQTPSGFGTFSCNLPIGTYTMVALGYYYNADDVFTLTSPTEAAFTSERPRETFCAAQTVTVTSTEPLDLEATLSRISARLTIVSTDGRSAGVAKIRTTYSKGSKSFNPTTGLALTDTGFSQTNNPSAAVGTTISVSSSPFLYTDEETMDITIEALDESNTMLFSKVVEDVPLKRNRITTLSGAIFSASASSAAFQLETGWLEGNTVNF